MDGNKMGNGLRDEGRWMGMKGVYLRVEVCGADFEVALDVFFDSLTR